MPSLWGTVRDARALAALAVMLTLPAVADISDWFLNPDFLSPDQERVADLEEKCIEKLKTQNSESVAKLAEQEGPAAIKMPEDLEVPVLVAAIGVLVDPASPDPLPLLVSLLESGDFTKMRTACDGLTVLGPDAAPAIPALIKALKKHGNLRKEILASLSATEQPISPEVLHALLNDDKTQRVAAWIIGAMGEAAEPWMDELARRIQAGGSASEDFAAALGSIGAAALPRILDMYRQGDESLRHRMLPAFESLGPAGMPVLPLLIDDLNNPRTPPAIAAMGPAAAPQLVEALCLAPAENRTSAYRTLALLKEEAFPALVAALDQDSYQPPFALEAMDAQLALREAMDAPDIRVRRHALWALASPRVGAYLKNPDPALQSVVLARAIQHGSGFVSSDALEALIVHPDTAPALRREAGDALFYSGGTPVRFVNLADELPDTQKKVTSETLPDHEVVSLEIPSEREKCTHTEYRLRMGEASFLLGRLYMPVDIKPYLSGYVSGREGYDTESLKMGWLIPGQVLIVQWKTIRPARIDVPADTTLLLAKEDAGWRERFRTSVGGYSGDLRGNDEDRISFVWNGKRKALRLVWEHSSYSDNIWLVEGQERPPLVGLSARREGRDEYRCAYTLMKEWPCHFEEDGLRIEPGTASLNTGSDEFPIEEIATFLGVRQAPGITAENLRALNPRFRDEALGTGRMVYDCACPPYVPDEKHYYLCVVSTATGALPGFLSECGQLHPLSDSALRAGV